MTDHDMLAIETRLELFMAKVSPEPNSGCWFWTGYVNHQNYGRFYNGKKSVLAHRWAYEHFVGSIPDSRELDHLCRIPCCVNPDHLDPVSHRQNILRGNGACARNAKKTHCPKGHPYSGSNLYLSRTRRERICRRCLKDRNRARGNSKID